MHNVCAIMLADTQTIQQTEAET